jgi:hypothetical protein
LGYKQEGLILFDGSGLLCFHYVRLLPLNPGPGERLYRRKGIREGASYDENIDHNIDRTADSTSCYYDAENAST